jgi:hypothetical protein
MTKTCSACGESKPLIAFRRRYSGVEGPRAHYARCLQCEGRRKSGTVRCTEPGCDYRGETEHARSLHLSAKHGIRGVARGHIGDLTPEQEARIKHLRALIERNGRIDSTGALQMLFGGGRGKSGGPVRVRSVA